jgi:uncharacterized protein (TIRG00374 family)
VKRALLLAAKLGVSLALLAYLLSRTDVAALAQRLRTSDTLLLVGAVGLYAGMLLLSTLRWHWLLLAQGYSPSLRNLSASYLVATFFNNFLPSNIGGDVIRVRDTSQMTGSTTASLAVVAIDRILGFSALYVLALLAWLGAGPDVRDLVGARPLLLGLGIVFGLVAYVFFRPGIAGRVTAALGLPSFPWAQRRFEVAQAAVRGYREELGRVTLAFVASIALQTLYVFYFYAVARSLRIPLRLDACFLMVPLCVLIQAFPVSFNGWGIRESVFVLYFRHVGLSADSALAFSLLGAGLIVLLSLSGAVVWTSRGQGTERVAATGS